MLKQKLGSQANLGNDVVSGVLKKLVGSGNDLDIAGLMAGLRAGGLASIAASWLGDGANEDISQDQVKSVLGGEKVAAAAADSGLMNSPSLGACLRPCRE